MGEDLSPPDTQVLALALEEGAEVVTDDYGIQHVTKLLHVPYSPIEFPRKDEDLGKASFE